MTPEDAIQIADEVLLAHTGKPLIDIQSMILLESLANKSYESMEGYAPQHIKNEGKKLWDSLSEALGEKVSKTSFKRALEKRWKLGQFRPKPPLLPIYNSQTWVGRKTIIDEFLPKLQEQTIVLWITGISGIGKTALGECLASQAWGTDPSFQWLYLEILEGQNQEFVSVAADLLAKLGEIDLDPQERNDPKRLMERLLRKLKASQYWLQVDSLERLFNSGRPTETEFIDNYWVTFFQCCLTEPNFSSRLVLTAQALPNSLAELEDRYPNLWQVITLKGLLANQQDDRQPSEHLELFAKNGLSLNNTNSIYLKRIGQIYEGHPLVLQVISKEILALPFNGDVAMYWERYSNEFEEVTMEALAERISPELYNQALQRRVRRRVEISLKRLPSNAFNLLCFSSVYRCPVPESFWLSLIEDHTSQLRQQAYQILVQRALVEKEGIHQNQFLIRQHNLIRNVAYNLLKTNGSVLEATERKAADLWLNAYEPNPDAEKIELIRGYLEAFYHYTVIQDWGAASTLLIKPKDKSEEFILIHKLRFWGYYQEIVNLCNQVLGNHTEEVDEVCWSELGHAYFNLGKYQGNKDRNAFTAYEKSLEKAKKNKSSKGEIGAYTGLGTVYANLGELKKSIQFHQNALKKSIEICDHISESICLGNLGIVYRRLGDLNQAIDFHQQALDISCNANDLRGQRDGLNNIAAVYLSDKKPEKAIENLEKSLLISKKLNSPLEKCQALGNLGIAYQYLGDFDKAIKFSQMSLKISESNKNNNEKCIAFQCLGSIYFGLEQYSTSIEFSKKAIIASREIGNKSLEANSLGTLGQSLGKLGQYSDALSNLELSLSIFKEINGRLSEAKVLTLLAILHYDFDEIKESQKCCELAIELARNLDNATLVDECEQLLSKFCKVSL
jgi:tetratricopeptide (TPR) repeat protein